MINLEGYPFFIWSGSNLTLFLMLLTSCFSGQVSSGSGGIAVEMTCIGCVIVRVHVESEDSCDSGGSITVEIVSVSRLETSVSFRLSNVLARLTALTSRGDSFFLEAPSYISVKAAEADLHLLQRIQG